MNDNDFQIILENFNEGYAPLAYLDTKTFIGNKGQASEMRADIISKPGFITQSPALTDLTNGNQSGVVDQLIRHILDKPTAIDTTFAIGTTKLFKLSSTAVVSGGSPSWPQAVTNMTQGESVIRLKANLYGFYNKASGGDILRMPLNTEAVTANWGSVTDQALQKAPHPSAVKEDIMLFGNGRYVGVYVEGAAILDTIKLDFGEGSEVADIVFNGNMWWIAVNYGEGKRGQIYLYDGSALSNILSDEAGVGDQKIGFLYVFNGIVYVAYNSKSSDGFTLGWVAGRQIKPLRSFSGTLPDHRQKALYKNAILFVSGEDIFSFGTSDTQLPIQISKLADGGHATVGGIASPFGVPFVASSDGGSNHRLAKFSGYSLDTNWKSIFIDTCNQKQIGHINTIIVSTKALGVNARCDLTIEGNQGAKSSTVLQITGENKTRHVFNSIALPSVEDIRVVLDWENGDTTNDCPIRKIYIGGNWVER
jgi:hypothetical protein